MAPTNGAAFNGQQGQAPYPALYLYPLNDSFVPKHIALNHGQHVKIGRQTNAKTAPGERNGYFDSKVLSRQHAEVWEEGGKIYIKDVKSSNGTFINSERLSSEAVESDPYELKSDDIVEFGIDIVGDDNKTIIHHKVAARVACIFTEQDYQVAARAEAHQQAQAAAQAASSASSSSPSPSTSANGANGVSAYGNGGATLNGAPNGFNFAGGNVGAGTPGLPGGPGSGGMGGARRAPMSQPTLGGMGGMGGGMRPPGKGGLTFDVILSRLQGELQKSRETGAELGTLTNVLGDVGDVLGGGLPPNLPSYPSILPPIRPSVQEPPAPPPAAPVPPPPSQPSSESTGLAELQAQLKETQEMLKAQVDKIQALEGVLALNEQSSSTSSSHLDRMRDEQEEMKAEVTRLRGMVEERRRMALEDEEQQQHRSTELETVSEEDEEMDLDDDDDDTRSVVTVTPDSNDEEDEERKERGAEAEKDRPRTPEPNVALNGISHGSPGTIRVKNSSVQAQLSALSEQVAGLKGLSTQMERVDAWVGGQQPSQIEARLASLESTHSSLDIPAKLSLVDTLSSRVSSLDSLSSKVDELDGVKTKLDELGRLAERLESVVKLTSTLEKQHEVAQSTIRGLESKVVLLEGLLKERESSSSSSVSSSPPPPKKEEKETSSLTEKMSEWMKSVDGKWASVQSEWSAERERLRLAREEWEAKVKQVDSGLQSMNALQAETRRVNASLSGHALANGGVYVNGDVVKHNGLVTPPSPRSQSSDSGGRYRRRRRGRGRSRSSSATASSDDSEVDEPAASTSTSSASSSGIKKRGVGKRGFGARNGEREEDEEDELHSEAGGSGSGSGAGSLRSKGGSVLNAHAMPTPAASVADADSNPPETRRSSFGTTDPASTSSTDTSKASPNASSQLSRPNHVHVQTAVGVLLLSVAAAAVIWKVRPDGR